MKAYLTVNGCQSRVLTISRMFGEIAARSGRRARLTAAYSDRAVSASGATSGEGYSASGTLEVSLPPARHSAPLRCRLRVTVLSSSFECLRPTKDYWRGRNMANRRSIDQ